MYLIPNPVVVRSNRIGGTSQFKGLKQIEKNFLKQYPDAMLATTLPDESTILAGSDQQAIRALKRNGLYSPDLIIYMEGRRSE